MVIKFAPIAGGSPAGTMGLTKYMFSADISAERSGIARYYTEDMQAGTLRPDMQRVTREGLGITPGEPLSKKEINFLVSGYRADGERIAGKTYATAHTFTDPETGERRTSTPMGAYDFVVSFHKSVSIAVEMASAAERDRLWTAIIETSREAMGYIAREIGHVRLGAGGRDGREPGHVTWIEFYHDTARKTQALPTEDGNTEFKPINLPADMQPHVHNLIPNAVFLDDGSGRVGSLDTARINGARFEADGLAQARLAQKLRELGVEGVSQDPETGATIITTVPEHVVKHFSKRSEGAKDAGD